MLTKQHNVDLSKPILKIALEQDGLIQILREALDKWYPEEERKQSKKDPDRGQKTPRTRNIRKAQLRYRAVMSSVEMFAEFLAATQVSGVTVDEQLIESFGAYLITAVTPMKKKCLRSHCCHIRKLINLLPASLRQRELVSGGEKKKANRLDWLSDKTKDVIDDFLRHGRKLKKGSSRMSPELSDELLSESFRTKIIQETLTFLKRMGITEILEVTVDDAEEFISLYDEQGKAQAAINTLAYIRPLFWHMRARGMISSDPLVNVTKRQWNENLDYVPQEGIDKLADLSTVDMADFMSVRNRLLAFSLLYDFALRNLESLLVGIKDVMLDAPLGLKVWKDNQKTKKENVELYSYFPEVTRPLMEQYVKLRAEQHPSTDRLIISSDGKALGVSGCRQVVKSLCKDLGIMTHERKVPTPHRMRHSFGSLNVSPLGRRLDITEVKDHYRHSSIETTYRIYIAKNPLIKKERHVARMRANGQGDGMVLQNSRIGRQPAMHVIQPAMQESRFILEAEAVEQLRGLKLEYRSLRRFGLGNGGVVKNGQGYLYSATFVSDLACNYFTRDEAMDLLTFPKATLFHWARKEGVRFVRIGQATLFPKDSVINKKRSSC